MSFLALTRLFGSFSRLATAAMLGLAIAALAACGGAAAPPTAAPEPTSASTVGEGEQAAIVDEHMTGTEAPAPSVMMAPTFELPNAAGETVTLASYAGDKNVVLVFYRGFW